MVINKATVVMENWKIPLTPRVELGYSGENDVCELEVITEPQEGFTYYLELQPLIEEANNILLTPDYVEGRIYVELTTEMLGAGGVKKAQIVAYIDTEDAPIKKSNIFEVEVDSSINATKSVESHYQTALSQWAQILASFNPQEILAVLSVIQNELADKQDKLTDGYGITIDSETDEISVNTEEIATKDYVISKQPTDTAKGNAITLTDSDNAPIKELYVMGKSTQNGTPTIDNPIPIVDITAEEIEITNGTDTQTAELNIVMRGIPVTSGGNYTDNNNQQWLCDTIERYADGSGKLIKRVGTFRIDNQSNISVLNDFTVHTNTSCFRTLLTSGFLVATQTSLVFLTDTFRKTANYSTDVEGAYLRKLDATRNTIDFRITNATLGVTSESTSTEVKNAFDSFIENRVFNFEIPLATPTETPLTAEQLAELDFDTYYPTTNINSNADVVVEYVADTKNYIDKKTSALQNAILSLGGNI